MKSLVLKTGTTTPVFAYTVMVYFVKFLPARKRSCRLLKVNVLFFWSALKVTALAPSGFTIVYE